MEPEQEEQNPGGGIQVQRWCRSLDKLTAITQDQGQAGKGTQQFRVQSRSREGNQDKTQSSGSQPALRSASGVSLCLGTHVQLSRVQGQAQTQLWQCWSCSQGPSSEALA